MLETVADHSVVAARLLLSHDGESPDYAGSPVEIEVLIPLIVQSLIFGGIVGNFLEKFHDKPLILSYFVCTEFHTPLPHINYSTNLHKME